LTKKGDGAAADTSHDKKEKTRERIGPACFLAPEELDKRGGRVPSFPDARKWPLRGTMEGGRVMKLFFGLGKDRPVAVCTDVRDCLPKGRKYQYQDGYSMAEAAKCWIAADEHLPRSIADVVGSNELITAHFEYPTKVWGGGIAMTDIMAFVPNGVIAVEAKVNERFDDVVSSWIFREEKKNAESPPHRTRVIQRYARVFGISSVQLLDVRYQLLQRTLCAALTAQALGVSQAWMVVQTFASPNAGDGHLTNRSDFDRFVTLVGSAPKIEGVCVQLGWASDNS
jgi:hypothetical protein